MNIKKILSPETELTADKIKAGLRVLTWEGMVSMGFASITTSGFLTSYAISLGASNLQIGFLAAVQFLTQPLQIPTILLIDKLRRRKAVAVISWLFAQLLWIPVALIPFFNVASEGRAISLLLVLLAIQGVFGAVTSCSWASWIHDLVPQSILGRFFSRRLELSTLVAVIFGIGGAFFLDYWRLNTPSDQGIFGYSYVLLCGAVFLGLASPVLMSLMPEPPMEPGTKDSSSLWQAITPPFKDANFRKLMVFLLSWGFATNLAIPFFTVYMLTRLELPIATVIIFSVVGQLSNIIFLRLWGPLTDKFGSKVILSLCASLQMLVIIVWIFTSVPENAAQTLVLLGALHIFSGAATAGISLTVGTLGLKLAPQSRATSYLAGASLANNLGTGLGPLAGGLCADFFNMRKLSLDFSWTDPVQTLNIGVLHLNGLDFLFALAFILGLVTLNTLASLHEQGDEPSRERVLNEIMTESRARFRAISSIPALNILNMFPVNYLKRVPGMDVAIGITTYQLADIANLMAKIARTVTGNLFSVNSLAREVENNLTRILDTGGTGVKDRSAQIAQYAANGVSQIVSTRPEDSGRVIRSICIGITRAMHKARTDLSQSFYGIGYGIVKGAGENGLNPASLVPDIMVGIREAARLIGLDEELAFDAAAKGILDAAALISPSAASQTKGVLSSLLIPGKQGYKEGLN